MRTNYYLTTMTILLYYGLLLSSTRYEHNTFININEYYMQQPPFLLCVYFLGDLLNTSILILFTEVMYFYYSINRKLLVKANGYINIGFRLSEHLLISRYNCKNKNLSINN